MRCSKSARKYFKMTVLSSAEFPGEAFLSTNMVQTAGRGFGSRPIYDRNKEGPTLVPAIPNNIIFHAVCYEGFIFESRHSSPPFPVTFEFFPFILLFFFLNFYSPSAPLNAFPIIRWASLNNV